MSPSAHQHEDKLLEFAYGELAPQEAKAVEAHLKGCPRCSEALTSIRAVRSAMGGLPEEPAPAAGLDSLIAYAQQAARRQAAGPTPGAVWWRRWIAPLAGVSALVIVGVVAFQANQATELKAPTAAKQEVYAEASRPELDEGKAVAVSPPPLSKDDGLDVEEARAEAMPASPVPPPAPGKLSKSKAARSSEAAQKMSYRQGPNGLADVFGKGAPPAQDQAKRTTMPKPLVGNLGERAAGATENVDALKEEAMAQVDSSSSGAGSSMGLSLGGRGAERSNADWSGEPEREVSLNKTAPTTRRSKSDSVDEGAQKAAGWESLLVDARKANQAGDRVRELKLAHEVLARGATGYARVEALKRLCDGYDALDAEDKATPYCLMLQKEFPNSAAARQVAERKSSYRSRAKKKASEKASDYDVPAELEQPAQAAEPVAQ